MVLIEQVAEPEPESKSTGAEVKPISGSKSHDDRLTGREDDTDGFETASEGEISDHDDNINNNNEDSSQQNQTHQDQNQQHREKAEAEAEDDEAGMELTAKHEDELNKANDLKLDGNKLFGEGLYDEALSKYELAVQIAAGDTLAMKEIRATCHANRAICFLKLEKYEETIKECTKALELNPEYLKALIRRGEAHEKLEHYEEAIADMEAILKLDPGHLQSRRGIARLKPLSDEKKEKMKEEMIGKLKEMGNSVLGRFGMSVDNFKAVKDPNTGSYSISFQR